MRRATRLRRAKRRTLAQIAVVWRASACDESLTWKPPAARNDTLPPVRERTKPTRGKRSAFATYVVQVARFECA